MRASIDAAQSVPHINSTVPASRSTIDAATAGGGDCSWRFTGARHNSSFESMNFSAEPSLATADASW